LPILHRYAVTFTLDFIEELPKVLRMDTILVVVD